MTSRVNAYFNARGIERRDASASYVKAFVVLTWFFLSYVLLVWVAGRLWHGVVLSLSLGLAATAVGFNIQHDGSHSAFSRHPAINRLAACTLDILGGSSYLWHFKHNLRHHIHPNVNELDDDIDVGALARMAPAQRRLWFHRYQQFYMWGLYALLALKWQVFDDFYNVMTGRIGRYRFPRPRGTDLLILLLGKSTMALLITIPLFIHPARVVLLFFAIYSFAHGLTLAVTFQLGHCVEGTAFPGRTGDGSADDWMRRQVCSTSNFATDSSLLSWLLGGLNFQIEHHLFPQVAHVHYPALAPIVREVCHDHGVPYESKPSVAMALASHYRWLREMGAPGVEGA